MKESETNAVNGTGVPTEEKIVGEIGFTETHSPAEVRSLTERKINVPDRIVLSDGKKTKIVNFESCEPLTYLRLCIDLNFCSEEGMI
jgi:hypothetical protein